MVKLNTNLNNNQRSNMNITSNILNFKVQKPIQIGRLSIFPLSSQLQNKEEQYLFLDDALNQKLADISEVDPKAAGLNFHRKIKVVNKSSLPLLILGGEQIIGYRLRQNRIVAYSVLISGNSSAIIDVNCSERNRWSRHVNDDISTSKILYFERANLGRQFKIWEDNSNKLKDFQVKSFTQSIQEFYKKLEVNNNGRIEFEPGNHDIGLAIGTNNKIRSIDFFGSSKILKKYFKKIIKSASPNIFVKPKYKSFLKQVDVYKFIDLAKQSTKYFKKSDKTVLGSRLRFYTEEINGNVLINGDNIIHGSFFAEDGLMNNPEKMYYAA